MLRAVLISFHRKKFALPWFRHQSFTTGSLTVTANCINDSDNNSNNKSNPPIIASDREEEHICSGK
jgi:hypothetical protein